MSTLTSGTQKHLSTAFRPKTQQYYNALFRTFVAFCICINVEVSCVSEVHLLAFLEYLVIKNVSANMLANYISANKAKFTILGLNYILWDHPNIKYLLRSVKINRPVKITKRHVMDLQQWQRLIECFDSISFGCVYKAVFLVAYFGFL